MCTIFAAICSTLMMGYLEQIVYSIIEIRFGLNTKYYFMKNWWKFLDVCKIFLNSRYIDLQKLLEILNPVNSAMQFTMDRVLRTLVFLSFVRLSWEFFFSVGNLRNLGMSWDFFTKACQLFKSIMLISYLFDNSSG